MCPDPTKRVRLNAMLGPKILRVNAYGRRLSDYVTPMSHSGHSARILGAKGKLHGWPLDERIAQIEIARGARVGAPTSCQARKAAIVMRLDRAALSSLLTAALAL